MRDLRYIPLFTLACFLMYNFGFGQQPKATEENPFEKDGTIKSLFSYTFDKSSNYKAYKVIDKKQFLVLQQNVLDSLDFLKNEISKQKSTTNKLDTELASLNEEIKETTQKLQKVVNSKNSINILDFEIEKKTYNTIVIAFLLLLILLVIFYIYKFYKSNILTKEAKELADELQLELENAQKSALNRYQILNRKYQDEIMKNRKE
ncbi:MAG: hypothetical protein ACPHXR_00100 [Flavicella sp.]